MALLFPALADMPWGKNERHLELQMSAAERTSNVIEIDGKVEDVDGEQTSALFIAAVQKYRSLDPDYHYEDEELRRGEPETRIVLITDFTAKVGRFLTSPFKAGLAPILFRSLASTEKSKF